MRHVLAKLLRPGHLLVEKRRYRRRGNKGQLIFQNIRLSFSPTVLGLIWSLQLAGLDIAKISPFWGSRLSEKVILAGRLHIGARPCFSGKKSPIETPP